jgi:hypothetical protein
MGASISAVTEAVGTEVLSSRLAKDRRRKLQSAAQACVIIEQESAAGYAVGEQANQRPRSVSDIQ